MDQPKPGLIRRLISRLRSNIVQETPPELSACEVCGKLVCSQEEWITCEHRLVEARCLEALLAQKENGVPPPPSPEPPARQT
jgi:hypothetical protein